MSIVRSLVLAHLGLTAALLLLLGCVMLCQRLVASVRPSAGRTPLTAADAVAHPSDGLYAPDGAVPAQEPAPIAAASVLERTVDLDVDALAEDAQVGAGSARGALQPSS